MVPGIIARRALIIRAGIAAGAATCALFAFTLGPALAAPSGVDPTPTATAQTQPGAEARLERLYQREQKVLTVEQKVLDRTNEVISRAQQRIDNLNSRGKDTSSLKTALDAFGAAVNTAKGQYDTAKSTLDAHAGFDANGNVIDRVQARDTLKSAGDAMREFHKTMKKARTDLRHAVRDYLRANRGAQKPQ